MRGSGDPSSLSIPKWFFYQLSMVRSRICWLLGATMQCVAGEHRYRYEAKQAEQAEQAEQAKQLMDRIHSDSIHSF